MSKAAKEYLAKKKLERMEWNSARFAIAWLIIVILVGILIFVFGPTNRANAGDFDGWEFHFFGINYKDVQDRNWLAVAGGAVGSLAVHELGHYAVAEICGGGGSFDWNERAVMVDDYYSMSDDQAALFHAAGFLAQSLVGTVFTLIPQTRHSDFMVGFNGFSSFNGIAYGITGGMGDEWKSDVHNLDSYGYNGTAIAIGSGLYTGVLTYISLDKYKED